MMHLKMDLGKKLTAQQMKNVKGGNNDNCLANTCRTAADCGLLPGCVIVGQPPQATCFMGSCLYWQSL
jgi:hypothetical protein